MGPLPGGPFSHCNVTADVVREFFARFGHGFVGGKTERVRAAGVAVNFFGGLQPGIAGLAHDWRGGVVVEIKHG